MGDYCVGSGNVMIPMQLKLLTAADNSEISEASESAYLKLLLCALGGYVHNSLSWLVQLLLQRLFA